MNIYGVIMAGGGGTRFWPLSRQQKPKQLLNLTGKDILVNEAIDRLLDLVKNENLYIVTNHTQASLLAEATTSRIHISHILSEPCAKNTAACIGYAAVYILKKHGDGVMIVTPSDAYIQDTAAFSCILKEAVSVAEKSSKLITIGIAPTFPATGYGYIKYDKQDNNTAKQVLEFKEKPNYETAAKYLLSRNYVWNSGMFIWRASVILENFRIFLPEIYEKLLEIKNAIGTDMEQEIIQKLYPEMESISIDYGIMEKSPDVLVIPGSFGWNDIGSWDMLGAVQAFDEHQNVTVGNTLSIHTTNSILYSSGRLVAAVDVNNLIIVETPDAVMVCPTESAQNVKEIVEQLKQNGQTEYL